jgi:hypothetical protein
MIDELFKEEKKCTQDLWNEKEESKKKNLIIKLLQIKKNIFECIKNKPQTKYQKYVHDFCTEILNSKKEELLKRREYFQNLHTYLKENQDTTDISLILENIDQDLLNIN